LAVLIPHIQIVAASAGQAFESEAAVEALLDAEEGRLREALEDYNKRHRIAAFLWDDVWKIATLKWSLDRISGDRAFVFIDYAVGFMSYRRPGQGMFEVSWDGERFHFHSHVEGPRKPKGPRVLASSVGRGCVYNYCHSRPCVDAKRRWQEFVALHELEMTPETAAIFQAYKENDKGTGDRLMALARGLPDPGGESVFSLQSEVNALNLRRFQEQESGVVKCDLNPYGVRPCFEVVRAYETFIARHGLTDSRATGRMFEAYTEGDYRSADVIYALATGKPVPAYGYLPTGVARDRQVASALRVKASIGRAVPCDISPYGRRPCLGMARLWREFAATYQLEDTAKNARIFAAYAEGEFKRGDQMLAAAKNVSLEQLQEAAGLPQGGLVIEVYPGGGKGRS
jgi:hypothetical protein